MCEVLGKVCADETTEVVCTDDSARTCPPARVAELSRCDSNRDCPRRQKCIDGVRTACNDCRTAAWKLRGNDELYDLTSNPEEDQKLFRRDRPSDGGFDTDGNGRLNCFQPPSADAASPCTDPPADSAQQKLCGVQNDLALRLSRWARCIQTPVCSASGCVDCDDDLCEDAPATCE
jgi:hypothetical protein